MAGFELLAKSYNLGELFDMFGSSAEYLCCFDGYVAIKVFPKFKDFERMVEKIYGCDAQGNVQAGV